MEFDKNNSTLLCKIPLSYNIFKELMKKRGTVKWLDFLSTTVFIKYNFEAQSELNLPTISFPMSVVTSIETQISPLKLFLLILLKVFSYKSGK